jgi:tripartite-type tricarboxylate transporter receptor subunit TctC
VLLWVICVGEAAYETRTFLHLAAGAAALPVVPRSVWAQTYPTRPVRIIVGFAAGSGPDIVARLVGQRLSEQLGQQFIVEDRPGAGSSLAAQSLVNAAADGHTLFMATGANTINATLYPNLNFNFIRDATPVAIINGTPYLLAAYPAAPGKTVPELIANAKANPGTIGVASAGIGTTNQLCLELLKIMTGIDLIHVPYRSSFVPDLLGGQVQYAFSTLPQVIENVKGGNLRALAVTSTARVDTLPDVPTMAEFVPGYEAESWFGIVAPKGTSTAIVEELNNKINAIVADPKINVQLASLGAVPKSMTPAEFGKIISDYTERWARVIRTANIKAE